MQSIPISIIVEFLASLKGEKGESGSSNGGGVISGDLDGTILQFYSDSEKQNKTFVI